MKYERRFVIIDIDSYHGPCGSESPRILGAGIGPMQIGFRSAFSASALR